LLGGLALWLVLASAGAPVLGAVIGLADRREVRGRHDLVAAQPDDARSPASGRSPGRGRAVPPVAPIGALDGPVAHGARHGELLVAVRDGHQSWVALYLSGVDDGPGRVT
jgi:hypothetical protein